MLVLFLIEMVLAVIDVFLGVFERKSFLKELTFIPHRIGVCILLRELVAAGVMLDAALGMPVIHCNLWDMMNRRIAAGLPRPLPIGH